HVIVGAVTARVPLPAVQIFFLVLHDQFHDGGYWRGGFSLRHLKDIADLSRGREPVDWTLLKSLAPPQLVRNAPEAQLRAAKRLFDADIPDAVLGGLPGRLVHDRHAAQFAWPALAVPLAAIALIGETENILVHRRIDREGRERLWGEGVAPPHVAGFGR